MRIVIKFEVETGTLTLPVSYNVLIRGLIYDNLNESLARKYHDEGFKLGKRTYKLFVFSRLMSRRFRFNTREKVLEFGSPVYLKVGALDSRLLESFATHLLRKQFVNIGRNVCRLSSIEVEAPIRVNGSVLVKAISPISVHKGLYDVEGKSKTYYFSPWEAEFSKLILDNLKRKAKAFYGESVELPEVEHPVIVPEKVSPGNLKVFVYKKNGMGYVIKGWLGLYKLRLPQFYFDIAYSAGLGARNGLGFGMVEVVRGNANFKEGGSSG